MHHPAAQQSAALPLLFTSLPARGRAPYCPVQLEVLERLGNVLMGQQMLPVKLGNAIADHAGRVLHAG